MVEAEREVQGEVEAVEDPTGTMVSLTHFVQVGGLQVTLLRWRKALLRNWTRACSGMSRSCEQLAISECIKYIETPTSDTPYNGRAGSNDLKLVGH